MSDELITETYSVRVERDRKSGNVIRETWKNSSGEIDRPGDLPARTEYCDYNGQITSQYWIKRNDSHREGGKPSFLEFDPHTGQQTGEAYWYRGRQHRAGNLPAVLEWSSEGVLLRQEFFLDGKRHRIGGPAIEFFDGETGKLISSANWKDGESFDLN